MTVGAILSWIVTNWAAIAATAAALGHFFPKKTAASKIGEAVGASSTPQEAAAKAVNAWNGLNQ